MTTVAELQIKMAADVVRLQRDVNQLRSTVDRGMAQIERRVQRAMNVVSGIASGFVSVQTIRAVGQMTDEYTKFTAQLELATDTQSAYRQAYQRSIEIAERSQGSLSAVGTLYSRLNNSLRDNKELQAETGDVAEVVSLALKVQGANAAESASAMLQLAQAFGSGRLAGEEFRAISESAPNLLRALAESLGVPTGALKEMAAEGKLTTEVLTQAFGDDRLLAQLRDQAQGFVTISGSTQVFKDALMQTVGELDNTYGASSAVAGGITSVAESIKQIGTIMPVLEPFFAGGAVVGGFLALNSIMNVVATTATTRLLPALLTFGPIVATIVAAAAAIGYIDSASKKAQQPMERLNRLLQTQAELQAKIAENGADFVGFTGGKNLGDQLAAVQANIAGTRREIEAVADSSAWEDIAQELKVLEESWKNSDKPAGKVIKLTKEQINALDELAKKQKAMNDALMEAETLSRQNIAQQFENAESIREQVRQVREQTFAYGANEKELRRLELAKLDDQIATVQQASARAMLDGGNAQLLAAYQEEINALRDLKAAKEGYYDKKAVVDQAATVQESFNKIFADISTGLTDALIRGFDNGKGLVESFFDYLKNYAKSLLVKIPVQYITSGIGGFLGVAGAGTANAAEMGGFGGLGGAGNSFLSDPVGAIKSAYSALTEGASLLTANSAAEFTSLISDFGFDLAAQGGFLRDFGTSVFNNAETLGQLSQAAGVAFTALSAFDALKDGRYVTAIGTGVGYALGGTIGATLGNIVGGFVDKVFGFGGGGGRNAFGTFDTRTGMNVGTEARFRGEADYDGTIATFGQAFEAQYRQIVETLGGLPNDIASYIRVKTDVGGDSPSDAYFSTYIDGQLVAALGRGGIGRSSEELQAALEDYAKRNLVAALANSNLDVEFRSLFASVNVATASIKELEAVLETANKLIEAQARFTALFGTDTEKLAAAQRNLNTQFLQLGQQMPSNIDQFKALILAQDRTTDSGRNTYLGLLDLAEQFAQLVNAQDQLQAAFDNTRTKTEQYLAILGGQTQTTLQQVANQMVALNNQLASTTDPSQRIALESQLSDLIFQRYQAEVEMLGAVLAKTQELFAGIESERLAVSNARATISGTGPGVMTAAQIRAEIAQASALGALPTLDYTLADSLAGQADNFAAQAQAKQAMRNAELSAIAQKQADLLLKSTNARAAFDMKNQEVRSYQGGYLLNLPQGGAKFNNRLEELENGLVKFVRDYNVRYTSDVVNIVDRVLIGGANGSNALGAAAAKTINDYRKALEANPTTAQGDIDRLVKLAADTEAKAEMERVKAQEAFADQISEFVVDAGKAVTRLSRLREETVKYYEAQERLAQLMGSSASGLRGAVDQVRFGDMNAVQQLQSLQADFAQAFASAQGASGESLAGYGNTITSLIDPILQKAAEVYASGPQFQAIKEAILSQALTVADRLESLQPKNYQMESLGLLDTIDTTLELIEANTKSAEALIVAAINESKMATSTRLEAVLAAIQGNPIPGFANGGMFGGGIRMVGERGPEIELTGASRIIPNNRLNDMFRPFDTRGIEERLDMIARDTAAQVRVLTAGMMQQSKQIDMLIDENRMLRKKLSLEAVK
ncbi:tape measure protein [Limnobacter alexandrii]|uniref:tape measure protein n=1 Tax=Limnobacter alexandrii TaxID=2570352 RepID=UPI001108344B|nr:tape measure protein [Limnobacter alexandrii]